MCRVVSQGEPFNSEAFEEEVLRLGQQWGNLTARQQQYPTQPQGDPLQIADRLIQARIELCPQLVFDLVGRLPENGGTASWRLAGVRCDRAGLPALGRAGGGLRRAARPGHAGL